MNRQSDFIPFCELWTATHDIMAGGKTFQQNHMIMIFGDLEDYPLDIIRQAVRQHRRIAKFAPTPNDIIDMIENAKGGNHLGAEEAWALAQGLYDESNTVIVTKEIMRAWVLASELGNDKFSASRAFKEKYSALIKTALDPVWFPTLGTNTELRKLAFESAVSAKRLTQERVNQLSLGLDKPTATVAGLLESAAKKNSSEEARKNLAGLKLVIDNTKPEKSPAELLREHEALLRDQHQQKLEQLKELYPSEFMAHELTEEVSAS